MGREPLDDWLMVGESGTSDNCWSGRSHKVDVRHTAYPTYPSYRSYPSYIPHLIDSDTANEFQSGAVAITAVPGALYPSNSSCSVRAGPRA